MPWFSQARKVSVSLSDTGMCIWQVARSSTENLQMNWIVSEKQKRLSWQPSMMPDFPSVDLELNKGETKRRIK